MLHKFLTDIFLNVATRVHLHEPSQWERKFRPAIFNPNGGFLSQSIPKNLELYFFTETMFNERYSLFISLYFFITSWISKSQEGRDISSAFRTNSQFKKNRFKFTSNFLVHLAHFVAYLYSAQYYISQNNGIPQWGEV